MRRLVAGLLLLALVGCADRPAELSGQFAPLPVDPTPRQVLAQACLADWCPLVKPAIAAELGCPPPVLEQPHRGALRDYARQ